MTRLAVEHAKEEIELFSCQYPKSIPLRRIPLEARTELVCFLLSLSKAGIAPPDMPKFKRGKDRPVFKLVSVSAYGNNQQSQNP